MTPTDAATPAPKNRNEVQLHGCIVCARVHSVLVVYAPDGRLVDCAVTSPGGHRVPDETRPLVACDTHTADEIEAAYQRWLSRNDAARAEEDE
jgi:hypothetical protein